VGFCARLNRAAAKVLQDWVDRVWVLSRPIHIKFAKTLALRRRRRILANCHYPSLTGPREGATNNINIISHQAGGPR
jgi:hypothetical protein